MLNYDKERESVDTRVQLEDMMERFVVCRPIFGSMALPM